jgi:hypothetical protein
LDPKDIAALAVFLASDAGKSISGQMPTILSKLPSLEISQGKAVVRFPGSKAAWQAALRKINLRRFKTG